MSTKANIRGVILLACLLCWAAGTGPAAAVPAAEEYAIKAAFLYNFAKFVDWGPEKSGQETAPIVIGVLGRDPFGAILDRTVGNKTVKGRKFVVKRFERLTASVKVDILFICSSEQAGFAAICAAVADSRVLTVSDVPGFLDHGGIMNFVLADNKVRFEINHTAAERVGLKISSKLLRLATFVR